MHQERMKNMYDENPAKKRDKKAVFAELFEVPDFVVPYLSYFVSEKDMDLALAIGKDKVNLRHASARLGLDGKKTEEKLEEGYLKHLLDKELDREPDKETPYYTVSNFYNKVDYQCKYDESYFDIPEDVREKIDEWVFSVYREKMKPNLKQYARGLDTEEGHPMEAHLLLDELDDFLEEAYKIVVEPCNCKRLKNNCSKAREICFVFNEEARGKSLKNGKELTKEEAKDMIKKADKEGLIHSVNADWREKGPKAMCNCCTCCCYVRRLAWVEDTREYWPVREYIAFRDEGLCINCGKCVERCLYGAYDKDEEGNVVYNEKKCWGCGLCKNTCPSEAIKMIKRL